MTLYTKISRYCNDYRTAKQLSLRSNNQNSTDDCDVSRGTSASIQAWF
ncbi:hypothetical protein J537_3576 [Acinetobacter baumannii 1437282]|nr:hypothetical protein J537_3576 [Acinetobacter baumannii 1437282]